MRSQLAHANIADSSLHTRRQRTASRFCGTCWRSVAAGIWLGGGCEGRFTSEDPHFYLIYIAETKSRSLGIGTDTT